MYYLKQIYLFITIVALVYVLNYFYCWPSSSLLLLLFFSSLVFCCYLKLLFIMVGSGMGALHAIFFRARSKSVVKEFNLAPVRWQINFLATRAGLLG